MDVTVKSKRLLDRQFKSLGIATDNSMGSANIFVEGAKAVGQWAMDNPEAVVAIADAGVSAATAQQQSARTGRSNRPPSTTSDPAKVARDQEISKYLNEFQAMSGTMRAELVAKGIITPGAQLETIRNGFADMLYSSPMMSSTKKATLIYIIRQMDNGIATLSE